MKYCKYRENKAKTWQNVELTSFSDVFVKWEKRKTGRADLWNAFFPGNMPVGRT